MQPGSLLAAAVLFAANLSYSAVTHAQGAPSRAISDVKAGNYRVDSGHTQVIFSISHFGFTNYSGFFSDASGTLHFDPKSPSTATLNVSISIQSVSTTVQKLTDELKGDKWFDVARYPAATFASTKVTADADGSLSIDGTLTLHGVTKPMSLKAKLVGAGTNPLNKTFTAGFEAEGVIKRGDYGISLYLPALGDEVKLKIAGAFELAGETK